MEALRFIAIILALGLGALVFDYGCYFQATIFTAHDGSGKGKDLQYRDPPYHPFVHPILWFIAAVALVPMFLLFILNISIEFSAYEVAGAVGAFLVARYILMRRGVS